MAKVIITLEDDFENEVVNFNFEMPEMKSEGDVTPAIITAIKMIESVSDYTEGGELVEEE